MRILDIVRAMRHEREVYRKLVGVCGMRTNEHPDMVEAHQLLRKSKVDFMKAATHCSEGDLELHTHDYLHVMDENGDIFLIIEGPVFVRAEYFIGVEVNVYYDSRSQFDTDHAHFELLGVDDQGLFYVKSSRRTEMKSCSRGIGKSPETLGELFSIHGSKKESR